MGHVNLLLIQLAEGMLHWWDFLNTVMDVLVSYVRGISGPAERP